MKNKRYFVYMLMFLIICGAAQADNNGRVFIRGLIMMIT